MSYQNERLPINVLVQDFFVPRKRQVQVKGIGLRKAARQSRLPQRLYMLTWLDALYKACLLAVPFVRDPARERDAFRERLAETGAALAELTHDGDLLRAKVVQLHEKLGESATRVDSLAERFAELQEILRTQQSELSKTHTAIRENRAALEHANKESQEYLRLLSNLVRLALDGIESADAGASKSKLSDFLSQEKLPFPPPETEDMLQRAWQANPDSLGIAQRLIQAILDQDKPLPDDIHERALRLALRERPEDPSLTYSLVALLVRQNQAPFPERFEPTAGGALSKREQAELEALVHEAWQCAEKGDTVGVYASLWQAVIRLPASARGRAEYARFLSDGQRQGSARPIAFPLASLN